MPRATTHAELARALQAILVRQGAFKTPYSIWVEIERHPGKYDAPDGISITAVKHACEGKPATRRTVEILTTFVRTLDPELLPEHPSKDVDLDLGHFFFTRGPKLKEAGHAIEGDFQSYALSTTTANYVRRGHVSFRYDDRRWRLRMIEMQHRPALDGHPKLTVRWEGYAAPKAEYFFAVLRTLIDAQDTTPMFYALRPLLRDPANQRIITLMATAMHYESEPNRVVHPTVFLQRAPKIEVDFIPTEALTNTSIRNHLGLVAQSPRRRGRVPDPVLSS